MSAAERWRLRRLTLEAMAGLCLARMLVAAVPFGWWRGRLGGPAGSRAAGDPAWSRKLAAHVDRGADRLVFPVRCLPRAMALSWMLRRRRIGHALVVAIRPPGQRRADDRLHAWIEADGTIVLGDLPGPWIELLRIPGVNRGLALPRG